MEEKDTYIQRLQSYADYYFGKNKFQFLNGGRGGCGAAEYVAFVEDYAKEFNPEIVIVFLNTDDIGRSFQKNIYSFHYGDKEVSVIKNRKNVAISRLKKIIYESRGYSFLIEHSHLLRLLHHSLLVLVLSPVKHFFAISNAYTITPLSMAKVNNPNDALELGRLLFQRLNNWCKTHNSQLLVITTGWNAFVDMENLAKMEEPNGIFFINAKKIFDEENIPFFDIGPELGGEVRGNLQNFIIKDDFHPNEAGSELIASISWKYLYPFLDNLMPSRKMPPSPKK